MLMTPLIIQIVYWVHGIQSVQYYSLSGNIIIEIKKLQIPYDMDELNKLNHSSKYLLIHLTYGFN